MNARGTLGRNREMVDVAARLRRHLPLLDRDVVQAIAAQGDVPCARGCAGCCQNLILATVAEGLLIAERLRGDAVSGTALRRRLAPEIARLADPGFARRGVRCVFLDRADSCSIYRDRPIVCRAYAITGDPAQCYDDTIGSVELVDTFAVAARTGTAFAEILPVEEHVVPLAIAVQLGLELLERGPQQFATWLHTEAELVLRPAHWLPLFTEAARSQRRRAMSGLQPDEKGET